MTVILVIVSFFIGYFIRSVIAAACEEERRLDKELVDDSHIYPKR
jgi:hypothetical protein